MDYGHSTDLTETRRTDSSDHQYDSHTLRQQPSSSMTRLERLAYTPTQAQQHRTASVREETQQRLAELRKRIPSSHHNQNPNRVHSTPTKKYNAVQSSGYGIGGKYSPRQTTRDSKHKVAPSSSSLHQRSYKHDSLHNRAQEHTEHAYSPGFAASQPQQMRKMHQLNNKKMLKAFTQFARNNQFQPNANEEFMTSLETEVRNARLQKEPPKPSAKPPSDSASHEKLMQLQSAVQQLLLARSKYDGRKKRLENAQKRMKNGSETLAKLVVTAVQKSHGSRELSTDNLQRITSAIQTAIQNELHAVSNTSEHVSTPSANSAAQDPSHDNDSVVSSLSVDKLFDLAHSSISGTPISGALTSSAQTAVSSLETSGATSQSMCTPIMSNASTTMIETPTVNHVALNKTTTIDDDAPGNESVHEPNTSYDKIIEDQLQELESLLHEAQSTTINEAYWKKSALYKSIDAHEPAKHSAHHETGNNPPQANVQTQMDSEVKVESVQDELNTALERVLHSFKDHTEPEKE